MRQRPDLLDRIRIASPCHIGWENMSGDDRVRFCEQCSLHVYDISEMTSNEARALIEKAEGRICARLHRRTDGTVITRDCPVGLRALRKRVARRAGAALTAVLTLGSAVLGQARNQDERNRVRVIEMKPTANPGAQSVFSGVVMDTQGAVISGASITLTNEANNETVTGTSTDNGEFAFTNLKAGKYSIEVVVAGFQAYRMVNFNIKASEVLHIEMTVQNAGVTVLVGVLIDESPFESSHVRTVIDSKTIMRLPLN